MNKASGGDGISVELLQIIKDDAVKVLHSKRQQIWKTQQWPQDWKRSVFIPIPKKGNAKECSNYRTIAIISHTSKLMLKILQARLQQYMNHELPDLQVGFRKGRGTRDQIANICWIIKKQDNYRKASTSALLTMPESLTLWITKNCGKLLKRWEYQATSLAFWEICVQVKQQQLELDIEQQTGSKSGKESVTAVYCHPAYLTYMPGGGGGLAAQSCLTLVTPWTVAPQAPLSMGFSGQEYWSGLPFPSPGELFNPGIEPRSPALQAYSLPTELWGKPSCRAHHVKCQAGWSTSWNQDCQEKYQ